MRDGLWQKIVEEKYLREDTVTSVQAKFNDSACWEVVVKVQDIYMKKRG
jgi:hypothetical protein